MTRCSLDGQWPLMRCHTRLASISRYAVYTNVNNDLTGVDTLDMTAAALADSPAVRHVSLCTIFNVITHVYSIYSM